MDRIKEVLLWILRSPSTWPRFRHESLHQLIDKWSDLDGIVIPHGVLTQEIEGDLIFAVSQGDVLDAQGAAAHSISLIFSLFIANSERQLVDQVRSNSELSVLMHR